MRQSPALLRLEKCLSLSKKTFARAILILLLQAKIKEESHVSLVGGTKIQMMPLEMFHGMRTYVSNKAFSPQLWRYAKGTRCARSGRKSLRSVSGSKFASRTLSGEAPNPMFQMASAWTLCVSTCASTCHPNTRNICSRMRDCRPKTDPFSEQV